jgi:hypothetical protein
MDSLASTKYDVECYDSNGNLKWQDSFHNLVVTAGLNHLLDATFKTGVSTPLWYVGLKGSGTVLATDTMASHSTWSELVPYSNSNRPAFNPGTISGGAVDNSANKAVFDINATATIFGCFLTNNNTKSGTTGILYGGGDFASSRSVANGDTLSITVTLTQAAV